MSDEEFSKYGFQVYTHTGTQHGGGKVTANEGYGRSAEASFDEVGTPGHMCLICI